MKSIKQSCKHWLLATLFLSFSSSLFAQNPNSYANAWSTKSGSVNVQVFLNYPFAYEGADGQLQGIEIDIINTFVKWLKDKKGISATVVYERNSDFAKFYDKVKSSKSTSIGAGTVSVASDRAREIKYSSPYLRNKPIFVTNILKPTLTDIRNISKEFNGMTAVIVKGSVHERSIKTIKDTYWPDMPIEYVESPAMVIDKISSSEKFFGYVDLVSYWAAIQKEEKPIKLHRNTVAGYENFAFIFPKSSDWSVAFNEFFDSGLGFPGTEAYLDILRKHLGSEVINAVAIQY